MSRTVARQMTPEDVVKRVSEISNTSGDNEEAHVMEDNLYLEVLTAISDGASDPRGLATEAIKASMIQFSRWYA